MPIIRSQGAGAFGRIRAVVGTIPRGRVATYGQVARIAGLPGGARTVVWALATLPRESGVPWHRVVGAGGRIALDGRDSVAGARQRRLLRGERVGFRRGGSIDLGRYGWGGPGGYDAPDSTAGFRAQRTPPARGRTVDDRAHAVRAGRRPAGARRPKRQSKQFSTASRARRRKP